MRVGEESILELPVGQARVLEHHGVEQSEAGDVLVRTLEVFQAVNLRACTSRCRRHPEATHQSALRWTRGPVGDTDLLSGEATVHL